MGGVIGFAKKTDCVMDLFFGTDYHSHLGTKRGGMCVLEENGFNRAIHNIGSSPFRTKFEEELDDMEAFYPIRIYADDATPEVLVKLMKQNGGKIGLLSTEGSQLRQSKWTRCFES